MLLFLVRRILATIPVLVIVALIVFLMLRLAPGDPAAVIVGNNGTAEDMLRVRNALGLDSSLPVQFVRWGEQLLRGNLGESFFVKEKVTVLIAQRLEPTVSLALITLLFTILIAVPLGVIAASRRNGWLDKTLMNLSVLGFSIPSFIIGYVLINFFALKFQWFPAQGYSRLADGAWPWFKGLILPSLTLSTVYISLIARVTRAAVVETLAEDYIRTARAKGISARRVLIKHALSNAAVPIVTVIGIGIALLIGGVVVTENVFALPGLGQLTIDAVMSRDFPLIQGITLFFSVIYVLINLLIDLSYLLFDPRIRY
ncbi:peptide ABC transporter [Brenneria goodwinii]|uniref:Dipeptide transport system permease protein DppB (TC 3.A.1.5.2) n=1 Tax=Brenneria goodwinii TaxID=1109412 RepID=A0A0G4JY44_9GAMM|nr:ABC transporter permease [Brenneria goodwinii]ATA23287.1 peptide ABC transporter [Brenneria goodwinii]RLM22057.1 peptide ABC transporter [Brenneria goodwinii]CPR18621.1 Dipeptide transport system permease protein DppB (TC 3.A.1.5.2) [Brenneria goodwinii]